MENTKVPLRIWLLIAIEMSSSRNGESSLKIERSMGIEDKNVREIMYKIRTVLKEDFQLGGEGVVVRADETWINRQKGDNKITLQGVIEKKGRLRLRVIDDWNQEEVLAGICDTVVKGSNIETDGHFMFIPLKKMGYGHDFVIHKIRQWAKYINGKVISTNQIEGVFGLFKSYIKGTNRHVGKEHLQGYADEFCFKFNRSETPETVFFEMLALMIGEKFEDVSFPHLPDNLFKAPSNRSAHSSIGIVSPAASLASKC